MEFFLKDDSLCITNCPGQGLAQEGLLDDFVAYVAGNQGLSLQNYLNSLSKQQRNRLEGDKNKGDTLVIPLGLCQ